MDHSAAEGSTSGGTATFITMGTPTAPSQRKPHARQEKDDTPTPHHKNDMQSTTNSKTCPLVGPAALATPRNFPLPNCQYLLPKEAKRSHEISKPHVTNLQKKGCNFCTSKCYDLAVPLRCIGKRTSFQGPESDPNNRI